MMSKRFRAVLAGVCVLSAAEAIAQRGAFRGKLIDEQGNPLEGVVCQAELDGGAQLRLSEALGRLESQQILTGLSLESLQPKSGFPVFHVEQGRLRSML